MGRRRRIPRAWNKKPGDEDPDDPRTYSKIPDPDPTSRDYTQDDVEQHHDAKIEKLLGPCSDSDSDTYDEEEEVLPLDAAQSSSSEEEEESVVEEEEDSNAELDLDGNDNLDGMPSALAWGHNQQTFYQFDKVRKGGKKPLQGEIEERAEEEKEAREIQRRQAEELQLSDFGLDLIQDHAPLPSCVPDEEQDHDAELPALERSVSLHGGIKGLSASSIRRLILADSPELPRLVLDLKAKLLSLRDELCPLIDFLAEKRIPTGKGAEFLQTKYHLYFNYCVNIMFYLALKGQRSLGSHPVIHRLLQYRNLVNDIAEIETESLKLEIHKLLANPPKLPEPSPMTAINTAALGSQSSEGTVKEKKNEEEEALNYYEEMVRRLKERREMKERNSEQPIVETQTPNTGKRKITLQIAKNKGLTPKRKKLDRNPRVKHKEKYRRALVRHKSQVLTVRHKVSAYGGERTGIRAGVRKGIKLQNPSAAVQSAWEHLCCREE
uniref:UTP3 small subunit processome component n=2 Tax=Eptatretus burgeri TaxID=7764 RepID=A0A8C4R5D2_EPTBU